MVRLLVTLLLTLGLVAPVSAQRAPDRSAEVSTIISALPQAIETEADDARRANLYELIRQLNLLDGGEWGALRKDDQGGKIPADIIVWRLSREHFDVMTGGIAAPTWQPRGVLTNPRWHWLVVTVAPVPTPTPTPQPTPEPPPSDGQLDRIEEKLDKHIESTEAFQKNVGSEWRAVKNFLKDKGLYILGAVLSGKFIWGN